MKKEWKREKNVFIKETNNEFRVVSCLTFVGIENNEHIYSPTLHIINKSNYPLESINEIALSMFNEKSNNMSLPEKIMYLSAFVGECIDIEDLNGERICFSFGDSKREASSAEIEKKLLDIINELNL